MISVKREIEVRADLPKGTIVIACTLNDNFGLNPTVFTIRYEQLDACLNLQTMPGIGQIDRGQP